MNIRKIAKRTGITVAALAVVGGLAMSPAANAAVGAITGQNIVNRSIYHIDLAVGSVGSDTIANGNVTETDLSAPVQAKLNKTAQQGPKGDTGAQGAKGDTGETGPQGPAGTNGSDAILSVMAVSSLVDRPDSGLHGDWAKDNLTRTVSITRQKAAKSSNCGGGATKCWFYTGSIADNGSFATVAAGKSPQAGVDIAGTVNGTVAGASQIEFYASSDAPDPALVDATVTGAAHPTSEWVKMFFVAGTVVTPTDLLDWSWTYNAPGTCEKWVNAKAGNTGDVTGVNAC